MLDILHKVLYTGIGLAAISEEKIRETVSELEKRGAVSKEEGKNLVDDLITKVKTHTDEMHKVVRAECDKAMSKMNMVPRAEYEALLARVEALEKQCGTNCSCSGSDDSL